MNKDNILRSPAFPNTRSIDYEQSNNRFVCYCLWSLIRSRFRSANRIPTRCSFRLLRHYHW